MLLNNLCVFDFETTGLDPFTEHVTELAAVRLRGGREVGSLTTFVNFGGEVPDFITELTGITTAQCAAGLPPRTAFALLRNFIGQDTLVAHNAAFDCAFLEQMYGRLGASSGLANNFLCSKTLAVASTPGVVSLGLDKKGKALGPYTLANLCRHFDIELTGAHRALNDVRATAQLLDLLRATYNEEGTEALLNCCGMGPSHYPQRGLPAHAKALIQS